MMTDDQRIAVTTLKIALQMALCRYDERCGDAPPRPVVHLRNSARALMQACEVTLARDKAEAQM